MRPGSLCTLDVADGCAVWLAAVPGLPADATGIAYKHTPLAVVADAGNGWSYVIAGHAAGWVQDRHLREA